MQDHLFKHYREGFIKKRPFSIVSSVKNGTIGPFRAFNQPWWIKYCLKSRIEKRRKELRNWELNSLMVQCEANLSRKPWRSGSQAYLKAEINYSAEKNGTFGIHRRKGQNEQHSIKKGVKTIIGGCFGMTDTRTSKNHI